MAAEYQMKFDASQIAAGHPETFLKWSERWPNFTPSEIASHGDGSLIVNMAAMDCLQRLRLSWKRPMVISSGYRDPAWNTRVGGAPKSYHMQGMAFDVRMNASDAGVVSFIYHATKAGFRGFGLYLDRETPFIHVDTGIPRTWQSGQSRLDDRDDTTELLPQVRV